MATTITTTAGTLTPTKYNAQRRLAECANGVRWTAVIRPASSRLEFWRTVDEGANWAEDTSQRITGVKQNAGCSLSIGSRADGQERLAVVYIDDGSNRVRAALGKFDTAARTSFSWQSITAVSYESSTQFLIPECRLVPRGSRWLLPVVWSREVSDKTRLMFGRMRYTDTSSGTRQSGGDVMLHQRVSSLHTHATIDVRHSSDVINEASPDLYIAWAQGAAEDPTPRQYMMRMTPTAGDMWRASVLRVLRESGTGPDPGAASATSAVFTGFTFACVRGPRGDEDDTLQLHLMDPSDSRREVIDVPDLGKGDVVNVGITYDPYNGDIFIVANGASDQNLAMITYQWPIRQFTSWADVTSEGAGGDSLSMKAGTSGKNIEGVYSIIAGGDRTVRHEIFATVNTIPSQPTWLAGGGAKNRNASLMVGPWQHVDVDGDSQTAYTLERRVNGGTEEFWNGISWQAGTVNITSAADSVTLSSGWATSGDTVEFRVRTSDGSGFGPWSSALVIVASEPVNPTILSPADEASVTVPELVVEWDVAEQSAYLVELKTGDGTGTLWSSEWVGLAAPRSIEVPVDLEDGATYDVEVTTQNLVGLTSSTVKHDISVSLTPPPKPLFTWTAIPDQGAIDVIINNGTAGGGEADADSNDIYQVLDGVERAVAVNVEANGTFRDRDVAADVVIDYLIVARTAVGATKRSDA